MFVNEMAARFIGVESTKNNFKFNVDIKINIFVKYKLYQDLFTKKNDAVRQKKMRKFR